MVVNYEYKISYMRGRGANAYPMESYAHTVEQVEKYLCNLLNSSYGNPDFNTINIEAGGFDVDEMWV